MTAVTAASWVFAVLLAIAGTAKITDPAATSAALQGARLVSDRRLVRVLGLGEMALAVAVLVAGGRLPALVLALAYAVFAVFAHRQSRQGAGCGCFGESDAPATRLHVALNVGGAGVAAVAAWRPAPSLVSTLDRGLFESVLVVTVLVLAAAALRLVLTALPELAVARDLVAPAQDAA